VNGLFPSHWSQQQNATINHSIYDIAGYDIIGSTSMSSASDSSPSLETAFRRVIEGGPDKEENVIIVNKKTFCEADKVLIKNCNGGAKSWSLPPAKYCRAMAK
jgi:hypothetical protein